PVWGSTNSWTGCEPICTAGSRGPPHRASGGQQLSAPGAREDDQQCPAPQDEDPAGEVDGGRPWLLDHAGG
ncbi:MAG TPA: hypothetical protein VF933_35415, partial [Streptosporangiaceae bacterium]